MISDFSYFISLVTANFFPSLNMNVILLTLPLLSILSCWVYMFANFIRSNNIFKVTTIKKTLDNKKKYNNKKALPYVSVIVPARDEQDNIERCLISLMEQDYPNLEIIAVDDNSTDTTLIKMKKLQQKYQKQKNCPTLNIIELKSKPDDWTGKTWASENGYLASHNDILLFVDADCYYEKNCLLSAITYMINKEIDVLTGYPFFELKDFWSKISMPLWKLMSITFGKNACNVNNPRSKVAYLMGCFFLIKRNVFENVGTFRSVRNAIQEDEALGIRIKRSGYKLRLIQMNNLINALWSRDLSTLWDGIGRTITPMILKEKRKVIINFFAIFCMITLPFVILLPYTIIVSLYGINISDKNDFYYNCGILILNLIIFFMAIISITLNSVKTYKISPLYAVLYPLGSIFLVIAYLASIIPLLLPLRKNSSKKTIQWKGRIYTYKRRGGSMI
jgi:cellulose synthase/poly-beta-1,6-N-acetylglucosamine synthase-like glycosyltransferase